MQPLEPGEHTELDTATVVKRQEETPNYYDVRAVGTDRTVELEDEEIRQMAELAGYTVTDEPGDA